DPRRRAHLPGRDEIAPKSHHGVRARRGLSERNHWAPPTRFERVTFGLGRRRGLEWFREVAPEWCEGGARVELTRPRPAHIPPQPRPPARGEGLLGHGADEAGDPLVVEPPQSVPDPVAAVA